MAGTQHDRGMQSTLNVLGAAQGLCIADQARLQAHSIQAVQSAACITALHLTLTCHHACLAGVLQISKRCPHILSLCREPCYCHSTAAMTLTSWGMQQLRTASGIWLWAPAVRCSRKLTVFWAVLTLLAALRSGHEPESNVRLVDLSASLPVVRR